MGHLIWWTGAIVLLVGGWALVAVLGYVALEYTLRLLRLKGLILGWYAAHLKAKRGRIITKKAA